MDCSTAIICAALVQAAATVGILVFAMVSACAMRRQNKIIQELHREDREYTDQIMAFNMGQTNSLPRRSP